MLSVNHKLPFTTEFVAISDKTAVSEQLSILRIAKDRLAGRIARHSKYMPGLKEYIKSLEVIMSLLDNVAPTSTSTTAPNEALANGDSAILEKMHQDLAMLKRPEVLKLIRTNTEARRVTLTQDIAAKSAETTARTESWETETGGVEDVVSISRLTDEMEALKVERSFSRGIVALAESCPAKLEGLSYST